MKVTICDLCKKIPTERELTRYIELRYGKIHVGLELPSWGGANRKEICDKCFEKLEQFLTPNK